MFEKEENLLCLFKSRVFFEKSVGAGNNELFLGRILRERISHFTKYVYENKYKGALGQYGRLENLAKQNAPYETTK